MVQRILEDLQLSENNPIVLYSARKSAINIVHNSVQYDEMKQVRMDINFIKRKIEKVRIKLTYIPSIA